MTKTARLVTPDGVQVVEYDPDDLGDLPPPDQHVADVAQRVADGLFDVVLNGADADGAVRRPEEDKAEEIELPPGVRVLCG